MTLPLCKLRFLICKMRQKDRGRGLFLKVSRICPVILKHIPDPSPEILGHWDQGGAQGLYLFSSTSGQSGVCWQDYVDFPIFIASSFSFKK